MALSLWLCGIYKEINQVKVLGHPINVTSNYTTYSLTQNQKI